MRARTQNRIDALHAEIYRLVEMEKAWAARTNPQPNSMWRHVQETQIDVEAWPPKMRQNAHEAVATLRSAP